jgi:hypothetical protein
MIRKHVRIFSTILLVIMTEILSIVSNKFSNKKTNSTILSITVVKLVDTRFLELTHFHLFLLCHACFIFVSNKMMLEQDFPHPMKSCTKGLFPFPYVDLKSLFTNPRAKNIIFPHIHTLPTIQHAYLQVAPLQPVYIGKCSQN